ncbi:MAG: hypothetical protein UH854_07335, partial [Clostridia bacterium]|nr:hypothetical protein [Clostridia bacterium]
MKIFKKSMLLLVVFAMVLNMILLPTNAADELTIIVVEANIPGDHNKAGSEFDAFSGYHLKISAQATEGETVDWMYLRDGNTNWEKKATVSATEEWTMPNMMQGVVKAVYNGVESAPIRIGDAIAMPSTQIASHFPKDITHNAPEYKFTYNERTYQLMDLYEGKDGSKSFYTLHNGNAGNIYPYANFKDEGQYFDPTDSLSVAYYMNSNTLFANGTVTIPAQGDVTEAKTFKFDKTIAPYLEEHIWRTEGLPVAGDANHSLESNYTFKAKLVAPSMTELVRYKGRFGLDYPTSSSPWYTMARTAYKRVSATDNRLCYFALMKNGGALTSESYTHSSHPYTTINPAFYLKDDFFIENHVAVDTMGTEVKNFIKNNISAVDMFTGGKYTVAELEAIGYVFEDSANAPKVENPTIVVEKAKPGYPATVTYKYTGAAAEGNSIIDYQLSDTADGTYTSVGSTKKDEAWIITNACGGKYLRAKVIPLDVNNGFNKDAEYYSTPIKIDAAVGAVTPAAKLSIATANTVSNNYKFVFDGRNYQMLDVEESNGRKKFFVYQKDHLGAFSFEAYGYRDIPGSNIFDTERESNVGYWLNEIVLTDRVADNVDDYRYAGTVDGVAKPDGAYQMLHTPTTPNASSINGAILEKIDRNHRWLTEAAKVGGNDTTFVAGISLLSYTEAVKYLEKIGISNLAWTNLRTADKDSDVNILRFANNPAVSGTDTTLEVWKSKSNTTSILRPAYYIDYTFFTDNYVAPSNMGSAVKNMIVQSISKAEMQASGLYTDSELAEIGYTGSSSYADNVVISGTMAVGQKIAARYIFNKNGMEAEEDTTGTKYEWYRVDTATGAEELISGADSAYYIVAEADLGKKLKVVITPMDAEGLICASGSATSSKAVAEAL